MSMPKYFKDAWIKIFQDMSEEEMCTFVERFIEETEKKDIIYWNDIIKIREECRS